MQVLTSDQVDHFLSRGFITIPGCFTRDFARPFIDHAYERMGCDPNDPTTWTDPIRYLDHAHRFAVSDLCPRAWGAICDVLGSEDRIDPTVHRMKTIHFSSVESFNCPMLSSSISAMAPMRRDNLLHPTQRAGTRTAAFSGTSSTAPNRRC